MLGVTLTAAQRASWQDYGYIVVEGFFDEREVQTVERALNRTWLDRPREVTIDDLVTGQRLRASSLTDEQLDHTFKINDLYLSDRGVRAVSSSERVVGLLGELLGDTPVICNSLNLQCGSQQPDHLDTLFMTPLTDGQLVATWMALEDVTADAGPLRYWPGSQRIEPFRFSTGLLHVVEKEMPDWSHYMAEATERAGLEEQRFLARRGDLFIWNAYLLHGGSAIDRPGTTRNSLVTHFWARSDVERMGSTIRPVEGGAGLWVDRPPQPIPGEAVGAVQAELAERAAAEKLVSSVPARARSLYERLRAVGHRH